MYCFKTYAACFAALLLFACSDGADDVTGPGPSGCVEYSPLRNVYFGDLHVHTALSFDSYAFDVRNGPDEAYRFARGEAVNLPPLDASGTGTQQLQLPRPLDFAAVTDHAEFLGEVSICLTPGVPGYDSGLCQTYRDNGSLGQTLMGIPLASEAPERDEGICGDGGRCLEAAGTVWENIIASANRFNDGSPDCSFTTFIGYEYTANTGASAQHRNVIFANDTVPFPVSYMEEQRPQGLWQALRDDCIDAGTGCDALAIPHNTNQSNGKAFAVDYPGAESPAQEREQAQMRAAIEPIVEIYQHKGDSECSNGFGDAFGAPDELCDFEKLRSPPFEDCGDEQGRGGVANGGCVSRLDFVRGALLEGLVERERIGANPYRLGVIGSTDTHNGTPGAVEEGAWLGHRGVVDALVEDRLGDGSFRAGPVFNPAGIAAVWSEENSRASLFAAIKRREVYGTSGPRIVARFFGGWNLPAGLCDDPGSISVADREGVPMGSVLPEPAGAAPSFLVTALQDPGTAAAPGTPLQRVQIIKGWTENGAPRQQVFEVAGDPLNGASVDASCNRVGEGFESLCTVWTDPGFSPEQQAFYYARIVENPSCRWTAIQCNAASDPGGLASCLDQGLVKVVQERAWTSPIWYEP